MKNKIIILGMLALSISAFAQETGSKEKSREKEIQGVSMTNLNNPALIPVHLWMV